MAPEDNSLPRHVPSDFEKYKFHVERSLRIGYLWLCFCIVISVFVAIVLGFFEHGNASRRNHETDLERVRSQERIALRTLEIERETKLRADLPAVLAANRSDDVGLSVLLQVISQAEGQHESAGAWAGPKSISSGLLSNFVDALASFGSLSKETASDLRKQLLSTGHEIAVESAKALLDRYIRPRPEPSSVKPDLPLGSAQISPSSCCCDARKKPAPPSTPRPGSRIKRECPRLDGAPAQ